MSDIIIMGTPDNVYECDRETGEVHKIWSFKKDEKEKNKKEKKMKINELLSLQKIVKERKNELTILRNQISVRTRHYGQVESASEPQYDVKAVDRQITKLQNWLFRVDAAIKLTNALTDVQGIGEIDVDELLAPLED